MKPQPNGTLTVVSRRPEGHLPLKRHRAPTALLTSCCAHWSSHRYRRCCCYCLHPLNYSSPGHLQSCCFRCSRCCRTFHPRKGAPHRGR